MAVIKRIASKATPSKIVNYLTQEEKTEEKLIGGKDCNPDNVVNEFNITQELYGKTEGIKYHHIIQSFSPEDDITPEKAHQLGNELAESQFKGHEVFVVTHKDKDHIHNHLVVNSVSFETGLKYNASNKSLWDIKRESNNICERENLKTIDLEHKAEKRISSAEKRIMDRGEVPWKDELRQIIDIARARTNDMQGFREFLDKNFDIETRVTKNSISYKHPDYGKAIRGRSLGDKYNKEELENEFNGKEKSISRNGERGSSRTEGNQLHNGGGNSNSANEITRDDVERAILFGQGENKISSIRNDEPIQSIKEGNGELGEGKQEPNTETRGIQGTEESRYKEVGRPNQGIETRSQGNERLELQEDRGSIKDSRETTREPLRNGENDKVSNFRGGENRQVELERPSETICFTSGDNGRSNTSSDRSLPTDDLLDKIAEKFEEPLNKDISLNDKKIDIVEQMLAKDKDALKVYKENKAKGNFEIKTPKKDRDRAFDI